MNEGKKKASRWQRFRQEIRVEIKSLRLLLSVLAGFFGLALRGGKTGRYTDTSFYLGNSNAIEGYIGHRRIGGDR